MGWFRARIAEADARIRNDLAAGERVRASGRAEDVTDEGGPDQGGATWTWVVITDRALRWAPRLDPEQQAMLDLDAVTSVGEVMRAHRYAIELTHAPIIRLARPPQRRFPFGMQRPGLVPRAFDATSLAFSRRDTAAAVALRAALRARGVLAPSTSPRVLPPADRSRNRAQLVRIDPPADSGQPPVIGMFAPPPGNALMARFAPLENPKSEDCVKRTTD